MEKVSNGINIGARPGKTRGCRGNAPNWTYCKWHLSSCHRNVRCQREQSEYCSVFSVQILHVLLHDYLFAGCIYIKLFSVNAESYYSNAND